MASTPTTESPIAAAPQPQRVSSLKQRIILVSFIAVVILTECLLAYLFVPSGGQIAAVAEARYVEELANAVDQPEEPVVVSDTLAVTEVELGNYSITSLQPSSNVTLRIDFTLFGTVSTSDKSEFERRFANIEHRLRDQVIVEVRNSDMTDLRDAGLGLIRRRILEKSNALFGRPLLKSVVFSDFSFVEQ